jgi:hypothetical protein
MYKKFRSGCYGMINYSGVNDPDPMKTIDMK